MGVGGAMLVRLDARDRLVEPATIVSFAGGGNARFGIMHGGTRTFLAKVSSTTYGR
jgi:hypothetical protein